MKPRLSSDLPRLWYSLFLGCTAAIVFAAAFISDPDTWLTPILAVGSFCILSLPALGIWAARIAPSSRLALGTGVALLLLGGIHYLFGIHFAWVGPVFIALLLYADFFLKTQSAERPVRARINAAFSILGLGGLVLWVLAYNPDSGKIISLSLWLASLLFLGLYFPYAVADIQKENDKPVGNFKSELGAFIQHSPPTKDMKLFLLFFFFIAFGSAQLLLSFLREIWEAPAWFHPDHLPGLVFMIAACGAFFSGNMIANFGMKRTLRFLIVLSMLLIPAMRISETHTEVTILAFVAVFISGIIYQTALDFYSGLLPDRFRGQGFAYHGIVLVFGAVLGLMIVQRNPFDAYPLFNLLLLLIALTGLHPIRTGRFTDSPVIRDVEETDWEYWETSKSELVRHHIFSRFVQILARSLAEIFFGRLRIVGGKNLRPDRGAILAANHPNTFLDPLLVTAIAPGRLHYWAKSTLWKLPVLGGILDSLGALPVYRRQDIPKGSSDNRKTLNIAANKLGLGAHILIFPEGVSESGLSLKPIKTGAARLGFQAMEEYGWDKELLIVPIGIDYHEPTIFRTHVTIRIGEPVSLLDYRAAYTENERETVLKITETVSERLKNLLPHLEEPELETLVHRIQLLYGNRILQILNEKDDTSARKAISEAVNHYQKLDPDTVYLFNQRVEAYFSEKKKWSGDHAKDKIGIADILKMLLSFFSFATYGLLSNWIPYRLTGRFAEWLTVSPVWKATAKMFIGGIVFGFYYLSVGAVSYLMFGPLSACLIVLSIVLSAFIALGALNRFSFRAQRINALFQSLWAREESVDLETIRVGLIQDLERFRESYSFYRAKE